MPVMCSPSMLLSHCQSLSQQTWPTWLAELLCRKQVPHCATVPDHVLGPNDCHTTARRLTTVVPERSRQSTEQAGVPGRCPLVPNGIRRGISGKACSSRCMYRYGSMRGSGSMQHDSGQPHTLDTLALYIHTGALHRVHALWTLVASVSAAVGPSSSGVGYAGTATGCQAQLPCQRPLLGADISWPAVKPSCCASTWAGHTADSNILACD